MTISKGDYSIGVYYQDPFGKRPGLYIGHKNAALKVGNFVSEEKAREFEEWLNYMCGIEGKPTTDLPWCNTEG